MRPLAFAILGFMFAAASLNTGARYFQIVLMVASSHRKNYVCLAWTQKTMLCPRVKRAAAVLLSTPIGSTDQVRSCKSQD
jgi:hypothetical protein